MILDTIREYLNEKNLTFEEIKPELDTCNIGSLIDKYKIKVYTNIKKDMKMHRMNLVNEFALKIYSEMVEKVELENTLFNSASYDSNKFSNPKIIYTNGHKETDITIKLGEKEIKVKGKYNKQVEIEFQ